MTEHNLDLTPQPIADGWAGECSCGSWRTFKSFYEFDTKDDLLNVIKGEFEKHRQACGKSTPG